MASGVLSVLLPFFSFHLSFPRGGARDGQHIASVLCFISPVNYPDASLRDLSVYNLHISLLLGPLFFLVVFCELRIRGLGTAGKSSIDVG